MQPLISIIIPVYNGEKFVKKCIESVMAQTLAELQIIVVDDGSTDHTLKILNGLALRDGRINVIHQNNGGVSKARNIGLNVVQAEWVLFVDADDTIEPDYCGVMLNNACRSAVDVLIARPYVDSQSGVYLLNEKEKLIQACLSYDEVSFPFNIDAPWGKLFRYSVICGYNIFFPEKLTRSEDAYFCLCFYQVAGKIGILNQFGYHHAEREGSLCRSFAPDAMETLEIILKENYEWVTEYHSDDKDYLRALWYRVLPGIVECERTYFLHPSFKGSRLKIAITYQRFLNQSMVRNAIHNLKLTDVKSKQYRIRLALYKLYLGWLFIEMKC